MLLVGVQNSKFLGDISAQTCRRIFSMFALKMHASPAAGASALGGGVRGRERFNSS